jgi:RimJ/RimL family protein N-acetyltransferase
MGADVEYDWRQGLPVIQGREVTLREPVLADAAALFAALTTPAVRRFVSEPPPSPDAFRRFISWVQNERQVARHVCFAVVPGGQTQPVGLVQVRELEAGFGTAEWGFAVSERFWGTGLFMECAPLVVDFAFRDARVHRLEARSSVSNARGNRVLQKLGAIPEGVLRDSFANAEVRTDQILWAMVADDWLAARPEPAPRVFTPVVRPPEAPLAERPRARAAYRAGLPVLQCGGAVLRELEPADAQNLASSFADPEVRQFIPQPPATAEDFLRFIRWTRIQRESGTVLTFGLAPGLGDPAGGVLQLHELEPPFKTAEWGFVLGRVHWGSGLFGKAADLFLRFAFDTVGVQRLEARAMAANVRANAVLKRVGATGEGYLRRSFLLGGQYHDDLLWALLKADWQRRQSASS